MAVATAVAALDKGAREELDEINVFLANASDKVAPEKLDGQGAEISVFANAVAVAAFEKVTREELDGQARHRGQRVRQHPQFLS